MIIISILTKRERQIFQYIVNNYSTKEIASFLHISEKTVRNHISNVILKLDVNDRTQAVLYAINKGFKPKTKKIAV